MPATKVVKTWNVTDNYLLLQNTDPTKVIIINKFTPPDNVWEGYSLYVEFDNANKGGGIFIKNKVNADAVGNLRLNCFGKTAGVYGLLTGLSTNSISTQTKDVIGHIVDALAAISASEDADRDAATSAAVAAYSSILTTGLDVINTGGFAYGVGGADFIKGYAVADLQDGTTYYDYTVRRPFVKLVWDGAFWKQVSISLNAIS